MSSMFQQGLQDLVKGIRSNRRDEESYMLTKLEECMEEAKKDDPQMKSTALLKLVYLQMFGHSFASSSFHVIEVMSRPEFAHKRVGYLAAAQSFSPMTDVLLLTTNQFKKDLTRARQTDASVALTCLAKICTEELGRDVSDDVYGLLTSSKPYLRRKALFTLYRISLVYPEVLPSLYPKMLEMLSDGSVAVVCASVTVLCELGRRAPKDVLRMEPELIKLLDESRNNWVRIKLVKLLGFLCAVKTKPSKSMIRSISEVMDKTDAKSLLYECCNTAIVGMSSNEEILQKAALRLGDFIKERDQNLKFLGLLTMTKLAKDHPAVVEEHSELILNCFEDEDVGVRTCALNLIACFIKATTVKAITKILLKRLASGIKDPQKTVSILVNSEKAFLASIASRILDTGEFKRRRGQSSSSTTRGYPHLSTEEDFVWYIGDVLFGLLKMMIEAQKGGGGGGGGATADARGGEGGSSSSSFPGEGSLSAEVIQNLADQLIEIPARVEVIREFALEQCRRGVELFLEHRPSGLNVLLSAVVFVIGENAKLVSDRAAIVGDLFALDIAGDGSSFVQLRLINACLKMYAASTDPTEREALRSAYFVALKAYHTSPDAEVQERSLEATALLNSRCSLSNFFNGPLRPQHDGAQRNVVPPVGLDLDTPLSAISDTEVDDLYNEEEELESEERSGASEPLWWSKANNEGANPLLSREDAEREKERVRRSRSSNPFYLSSESKEEVTAAIQGSQDVGVLLDLEVPAGGTDEAKRGSRTKLAKSKAVVDVFLGEEEMMPTSYRKDDYEALDSLGIKPGPTEEDDSKQHRTNPTLLVDDLLTSDLNSSATRTESSSRAVKEPKTKKKKKKKTKRDKLVDDDGGDSREKGCKSSRNNKACTGLGILIDVQDESAETKVAEKKKDDKEGQSSVLDLLS